MVLYECVVLCLYACMFLCECVGICYLVDMFSPPKFNVVGLV